MQNFELIDDYLTNRLGDQEKMAFEQRMGSDPGLKSDVEMQRNILDGVKQARVAELKAMLNNVPVGNGISNGAWAGKIAAGIVAVGLAVTAYWIINRKEPVQPVSNEQTVAPVITAEEPKTETPATKAPVEDNKPVTTPTTANQPGKKATAKKKEAIAAPTATAPKIEVVDPSKDELIDNSSKSAENVDTKKSAITVSQVAVETVTSDKKYKFNYQFEAGKLVLYGPFDKSLYEILEIHGDSHAVFLWYKDNYYKLDEQQHNITRLEPITDATLVKKLKEYRGK